MIYKIKIIYTVEFSNDGTNFSSGSITLFIPGKKIRTRKVKTKSNRSAILVSVVCETLLYLQIAYAGCDYISGMCIFYFGSKVKQLDIQRSAAYGDVYPLTDCHNRLVTSVEIISTSTVSIIVLKKKFGMYYKHYQANIFLLVKKIDTSFSKF
jgi:hypothetical protein